MIKTNIQLPINVERLCKKCLEGEISIGDVFIVDGRIVKEFTTKEKVVSINHLGIDTISKINGRTIERIRYFPEFGYSIHVGYYRKGISKDFDKYDRLLNEVKEEDK